MIKNKKQSMIIIGAFIFVLMLFTTTYAFFNYTRTGTANNIRTGKIYFNADGGNNTVTLSDLFPISVGENETITSSTPGVGSLKLHITGDTTYTEGIEYLIEAVEVTGNGNTSLPISIDISYTPTEVEQGQEANVIGTSDNNYFTNRGGETSRYKLLSTGSISEGEDILVGYIAPGATGIDGELTILAYLDADNIAITDTYDEDEPETDLNGTTTDWVDGRTVFTTEEWNALQATGVSFKIKTTANEGTWVENPNTLYNKVKVMSRGTMNAGTDFGVVASSDAINHPYGVYQLVESNLTNPIYFYRGDHTVKNNVVFDNKCWLIVRTTETNSTRMIYNGTPVNEECTTIEGNNTMISLYVSANVNSDGNYEYSYTSTEGFTTLRSGPQFQYNVNGNNAKYVGYTYDNGVNSNMKNALEAWYEGAISSEAKAKIETSTYCNDTRVDESVTSYTQYMPNTRANANTPSVVCPAGANAISSKVGFLTVDEEIMAGRTWSTGMQDYLYNNKMWWLGSPYYFNGGVAYIFNVNNNRNVNRNMNTSSIIGLRPVVSILSDTVVTGGDGSQTTPWIIG